VIACEVVELMCMVPPFLDGARSDYSEYLHTLSVSSACSGSNFAGDCMCIQD